MKLEQQKDNEISTKIEKTVDWIRKLGKMEEYVVDRIERVITEATLLLEGSNQIYKENCPLCGTKSVRRRETGEYCCEACDGVWAANTVNNLDTIWLKRIRLK